VVATLTTDEKVIDERANALSCGARQGLALHRTGQRGDTVARQGFASPLRALDPMATEVRHQSSEPLRKKVLTG
jgi:hypothetical protein